MHSVPDLKSGLRKIKGKAAILNITNACNARCIFCSEGEHLKTVNVELDTIKKTILSLKTQGVEEINFMGGETTLRDDLVDILEFIKKQDMVIYLVTNGIRFADKKFARSVLPYFDSLEISCHASDRKMYRRLMGVDAYRELQRGITHIAELSSAYIIFFNIVPNSINFPYIPDIMDQVKRIMGDKQFMFHIKTLNVEGKVENGGEYLVPHPGHSSIYLKEGIRHALDNKLNVVISRFPLCLYSGYEFLCLEIPLQLRDNTNYFYNNILLHGNFVFQESSLLDDRSSYRIPQCRMCTFKKFCPALDAMYVKLFKDTSFLTPQSTSVDKLIRRIIEKSHFFRIDYNYHTYTLPKGAISPAERIDKQ